MVIPRPAAPAIHWPTLPFFQPEPALPAGHGRPCTVELTDGRNLAGELLRFEPGEHRIHVRTTESGPPDHIDLAEVRWIKLTRPVELVPDTAALDAVGTTAHRVAHDKPFVVQFQDRGRMEGKTRGFVKDKAGLFLYLVGEDPLLAVNCFIPALHIKDVQIGPPLGQTLLAKDMVSRGTLDTALRKQVALRAERIGEYLTARAIISADQLARALLEQQRRPTLRLGDVLVEAKVITPEQLEQALAIQAEHRERRLGDILVDMGAVTLRLIQVALADKLGIPYVNVREFKVEAATLRLIDPVFAARRQVLPLLRTGDSLVIAVENPLAIDFAQDLRFTTGLSIVPVIADPTDLKARIAKEYSRLEARTLEPSAAGHPKSGSESNRTAARNDGAKIEELAGQLTKEAAQPHPLEKIREVDTRVSDNTLVKLVNKIIVEAHTQGASDIHIECNPGLGSIRIRLRKDGDLEDYLELPPNYRNALISRIKIMSDLDISEHRLPQDGKIEFGRYAPLPIELRVAVIPTANGLEDVVLRILGAAEPKPLEELGLAAHDLGELRRMIARSYGLILVCGPTGSGKTTTLHSILHHINQPDLKIWTAEDPVEITQPGLRQVQVQAKIGWTFAAAMRAFLRADPDVIMVGEMRDAETTKIGIEASLTGHLVFSTLHTNSAAESIVRLLDLGMDPFNFSDALIGILAQRLARTLCPRCKQSRPATLKELTALAAEYCSDTRLDPAEVLTRWQADYAPKDALMLHEPVGCSACRGGYKGRVGIYELLVGTPSLKDLVRTRAPVPQLVEAGLADGMRLLRQDAIEKVLRGDLDLISARSAST